MSRKRCVLSVIAACYNHEKYVQFTLDSIAQQMFDGVELIIIDDGSKDDSAGRINEWLEKHKGNYNFIRNEKNIGVCATFNKAIKKSSGKYIKLIACDDILPQGVLEKQVGLLEKSSDDIALVCGNVMKIDENGEDIGPYFPKNFSFPNKQELLPAILKGHEGLSVMIQSPSAMLKRVVFEKIGYYPEYVIQEDFYMWVQISLRYNVLFINEIFAFYRVIGSSLSNDPKYRIKILQDRLIVCSEVLKDVEDSSINSHLIKEMGKIYRKVLYDFLSSNQLNNYERFFEQFYSFVKRHNISEYYLEKALKNVAKKNLRFANQILANYPFKIRSFGLRLYLKINIPFLALFAKQ